MRFVAPKTAGTQPYGYPRAGGNPEGLDSVRIKFPDYRLRGSDDTFTLLVLDDFPVFDFHEVDTRYVLAALLARRALLDECDIAVDAFVLHAPERLLNRHRVGLACRLDGFDDRIDAVPAAEPFGQAAHRILAGVPLGDEFFGDIRIFYRLRKPRRKEHEMHRAVGSIARLLNQLVRRNRSAGCDDALLQLLLFSLLQDQRRLFH